MPPSIYSGWVALAKDFPPTLNTQVDSTQLKVGETPSCYGVSCSADGLLEAGSIPTGTARLVPTKTVSSVAYDWYFSRLWAFSGTTLRWYAPQYDDALFYQDLGKMPTDATIIEIIPFADDSMLIVTATGAHILANCSSHTGNFQMTRFIQDMYADATTKVLTMDGIPYVSNAKGVFAWSNGLKELTNPVRNSLGSFSNAAITADYQKKQIIGTSKFVIDVAQNKLFDYGTTGFLFTSRTLTADPEARPFTIDSIGLVVRMGTAEPGTITWQSKSEDGDWFDEKDIELKYTEGKFTRVEASIGNTARTCQRFAIRLTALPSNAAIREIQVCVEGLAIGAATK